MKTKQDISDEHISSYKKQDDALSDTSKTNKKKPFKTNKITRSIGIVIGVLLCVVSIPVIIFNLWFIVQGLVTPDKVPSMSGKTPLIVLTDSMYPTIQGGDLIICDQANANDIKVGDVISFFDPASTNSTAVVTHRVVDMTNGSNGLEFSTKGDANNNADRVKVPANKLVGKYDNIRIAGLGSFCMWLKSVPGIIICVGIPLVLLLGYDIIRRRIYAKKQSQKEDELRAELEKLKAQRNN